MSSAMQSWAVVVPVKRLSRAKTRLAAPGGVRADLALAMAIDTVVACRAAACVRAVVVVTDDERAARAVAAEGADVVADAPDAGLNPALRHGAAIAAELYPGTRVAAVSSDLPALSATSLADVLARAAEWECGCVADLAGTGTTVLAARAAAAFAPEFGPHSLLRHVAGGAVDLTELADARVRRDVDTLADLQAAVELGCGAATAAVVAASSVLAPRQ